MSLRCTRLCTTYVSRPQVAQRMWKMTMLQVLVACVNGNRAASAESRPRVTPAPH